MDSIIEKHIIKVNNTNLNFVRSIIDEINLDARLIGIKGARGVGKTTFLLQFIKQNNLSVTEALYVSLDNLWFAKNNLLSFVDSFEKRGGKYLFLDEVHKYPNWSQELKNIYDDFPTLKVIFTGSSLLEILNARADLSRRAIVYKMQGLSFREYLNMNLGTNFQIITLDNIVNNHIEIAQKIINQIKPLKYFSEYLKTGYYPFYNELPSLYYSRIEEVINMMLEIELPLLRHVDIAYISKIKQLLLIISESVPFIPNINKLSERIGINRTTFLSYLKYLHEIGIIHTIYKDAFGISKLQKPDKLLLENPNFIYAISSENANPGNLRETFFVNQLSYKHKVTFSDTSDFVINSNYTFEIGGKGKTNKQIKNISDSFIVSDNIEYGFQNKIPLWLFGFLY
jgi:predicted AAA+ superfamily ATPase